jgi:predicted alpha/beta-fold hydrolase
LKQIISRQKEAFGKLKEEIGITIEELLEQAKTCYDYEVNLIKTSCKQYISIDDYFRKESCAMKLSDTRIPIFFLSALDDPIVPYYFILTT